MATWADDGRVLELTGVTVTSVQLEQAQGVIDLFSGVTVAATSNLTPRDLRLLGQAHAYQAAWLAGQIDTFTRTDVSNVSQDEMSFSPAHEDALVLAPLARRCLQRLSWLRRGSLRARPFCAPGVATGSIEAIQAGFLRDEGVGLGESYGDWRPL